MKILTHYPQSCIDVHLSSLVWNNTSQYYGSTRNQDGGKQNGRSPCHLKMTTLIEIVQAANRQKVADPPRKW